jgi:hypothetical protein
MFYEKLFVLFSFMRAVQCFRIWSHLERLTVYEYSLHTNLCTSVGTALKVSP